MKTLTVLLSLFSLACGNPTSSTPKPQNAIDKLAAAQPDPYRDDDATRQAVKVAILHCGLAPEDPSALSVWLKADTWTSVEGRRRKLEQILKWSKTLPSKTLRVIYEEQIAERLAHVVEAEDELRDHALQIRQEAYEKTLHAMPKIEVPEPPCITDAPIFPKPGEETGK